MDSGINETQTYVTCIQGDQKVSVHLTIAVQKSGAQRLFIILYIYTYANLRTHEDSGRNIRNLVT